MFERRFKTLVIDIPGPKGVFFESTHELSLVPGKTFMAKFCGEDVPLIFKDISYYKYVPGTSDWKEWITQGNDLEPKKEYLINKGNNYNNVKTCYYVSSSDSDEDNIDYPAELKSGFAICKSIEAQVFILI